MTGKKVHAAAIRAILDINNVDDINDPDICGHCLNLHAQTVTDEYTELVEAAEEHLQGDVNTTRARLAVALAKIKGD